MPFKLSYLLHDELQVYTSLSGLKYFLIVFPITNDLSLILSDNVFNVSYS